RGGKGNDIISGGDDGGAGAPQTGLARLALVPLAAQVAGDVINAGDGRNLVFGDDGELVAARTDINRFGGFFFTLGLARTVDSSSGGADRITSGSGEDIIFGGFADDIIDAGDGNNIVFGDHGLIDWTAVERGG